MARRMGDSVKFRIVVCGYALTAILASRPSEANTSTCGTCANASFRGAPRAIVDNSFYSTLPLVVDFDRDGNLDVAVVSGSGVTVFLGRGGGEFGPGISTEFPYGAPVAVGDFDEDGFPDLVEPGFSVSSAPGEILFGGGSGRFRPGPPLPETGDAVAVGDFDGDGHLDVVVGSRQSSVITLLRGDGHGNMTLVGTFPTNLPIDQGVGRLVVGNLNGDGFQDLVVGGAFTGSGPPGSDNGIAVLLGGPAGFGPPTLYPGFSSEVQVVDLDGDGHDDVVAAGEQVEFRKGDGAGHLSPVQTISMGPSTFSFLRLVRAFDLNGDGMKDLVAVPVQYGDAQIRIRLADGTGGFGSLRQLTLASVVDLAIADVDGDGLPDFVIVSSDSVSIAFNDGSGGFEERLFPALSQPTSIVAADFDGDGKTDVAIGGYIGLPSEGLAVLYGNGAGGLSAPVVYPGSGSIPWLAAIDVGGDAKKDLVGNDYSSASWVRLNDGTGAFGPKIPISDPGSCSLYGPPVSADFNHDGHADLVFPCRGSIVVFFGDGTGAFPSTLSITTDYSVWVGVEDIDGDGNFDIVGAGNFAPNGVATFLGDGAGHFGPPIPSSPPDWGSNFVLADFDGDGHVDIAQAAFANGYVLSVLYGDGTGKFGSPRTFPMPFNTGLVAVDLNGDGRPDVVALSNNGIDILMNDGSGGFLPPVQFLSGNSSSALAFGDFDSDGKPDFVIASQQNTIAMLLNSSCVPRRTRVVPRQPGCSPPEEPIAPPISVQAIDDGGNVACATGSMTASLISGPAGESLGGSTTVPMTAGTATFSELKLGAAGRYRLRFTPSGGSRSTQATFSSGASVSVAVTGPSMVCGTTPATYDAGPGYSGYLWTIDGVPISTSRTASLGFLPTGPHTLEVRVQSGGCEAVATATVSNAPPQAVSISPANGPAAGGIPVVVSGTCFAAGATLALGGTLAISPITVSSSSLNAKTAGHLPGTVDVVVTNPDGQGSTKTDGYTYVCSGTTSVTVGGDTTVCAGTNVHLPLSLTGQPPWTLNWSDGAVQTVYSSPAERYVTPTITTTYSVVSVVGNFCPGSASGSATVTIDSCPTGSPAGSLIPDGRSVRAAMLPGGNVYTFQASFYGVYYVVDVEVPIDGIGTLSGGGPQPLIAVTRSGGVPLNYSVEARERCSPAATTRAFVTATYSDIQAGPLEIHVSDPTSSGYEFRIRVMETTLFAARWSTNGFRAFVDVQNTTECIVEGSGQAILEQYSSAADYFLFSLAPGESLQRELFPDSSGSVGSVRVFHNGPPGAITGGVYMVSPTSGHSFRWPLQEVRSYGASDGK